MFKEAGVLHDGYAIEDPPGFVQQFGGFSPVSLSSPNLPFDTHEAVCEAGDVLFLPPGWWHEVHSLPDARQRCGYSLSLNYWEESLFGVDARDHELESTRAKYLDATQQLHQESTLPAWMDAF